MRPENGFTLLELLVVIGISAMLAAVALVYSGIARNQVALSVESAAVAQTILRAKDLSIATYAGAGGSDVCGYGAVFDIASNTYSIFAYEPKSHPPEHNAPPPCPADTLASTSPIYTAEIAPYSSTTWNVPLPTGVKLIDGMRGDNLAIVLFFPPNPDVFISRDGVNFLSPTSSVTSKVYLETADGGVSTTVVVNGAGNVTF